MGKESFKKSDNKNNIQFSKSAIVIDFIGRTIMETFRASGSWDYWLDTIQDFLCKLGMKPNMHLVKIVFFLELVSKELNHFGVIAGLFRQIGGHSSRFVLFCSF